jgi:hypothetical protein
MSRLTDKQITEIGGRFFGCGSDTNTEIEFARAIEAEVIEACAVAAWCHYMDTCKSKGIAPAAHEHWLAAKPVRESLKPGIGEELRARFEVF